MEPHDGCRPSNRYSNCVTARGVGNAVLCAFVNLSFLRKFPGLLEVFLMKEIGESCRCGRTGGVVHVAVSHDLLTIPSHVGRRGFICKVGATINDCHDRWRDMNDVTARRGRGYAGVKGWRFLKCWSVGIAEYDEKQFRPWALVTAGIEDLTEKALYSCRDLYFVSDDYRPAVKWASNEAALNNEIVTVAASAVCEFRMHGFGCGLDDLTDKVAISSVR